MSLCFLHNSGTWQLFPKLSGNWSDTVMESTHFQPHMFEPKLEEEESDFGGEPAACMGRHKAKVESIFFSPLHPLQQLIFIRYIKSRVVLHLNSGINDLEPCHTHRAAPLSPQVTGRASAARSGSCSASTSITPPTCYPPGLLDESNICHNK